MTLLSHCAGEHHRIVELLRVRSSVRQFQHRPVPAEILQEILEAGRLSPSGGNEQSWAFGVITDRDLIAQIAEIAYRQTWIARAPLLVVLVGLLLWELLVRWRGYPSFILPSPTLVWSKFTTVLADGTLLRHTMVTLVEIALGLFFGLSVSGSR